MLSISVVNNMHSPPQEVDSRRRSHYRESSGAVCADGTGLEPEDHCIGMKGYHSPEREHCRETNDLNGFTASRYPPAPNFWHGDHQMMVPYASFDYAPAHPDGRYEQTTSDQYFQTSSDQYFQTPAYPQNPPITSSSPQQPAQDGSDQGGTRTEGAFDPPQAFSPEMRRPSAYYGGPDGAVSHLEQENPYVGHSGQDPGFHYPHYHQQQHYYGAQEAQEAHGHVGTMQYNSYGDQHPHHPIPPWQEHFRYHGAVSWPHYPPHPPHVTWQTAYHPPSHPHSYYEYNRHVSAGHKDVHSGRLDSTNGIGTAPVSKYESSQSQGKSQDTKLKTSRPRKDPNKPKRPLSAYNIFFREERTRMIAELETSKDGTQESGEATHGDGQPARKKQKLTGVGFKPMAQRVASKWKALDKEALAVYEKMAAEDLRRYRQEMKEYNKSERSDARDLPALDVGQRADKGTKPSNENTNYP